MAMKKTISKALAMAVMMSVLAGGSAYADGAWVDVYGNGVFTWKDNGMQMLADEAKIELNDDSFIGTSASFTTGGIEFSSNEATIIGLKESEDKTAAATVSQLDKKADKTDLDKKADKTQVDNHENRITALEAAGPGGGASSEALEKLDSKINQTNDRVDRVGATAAALAAINYQPMAKGQSQVAIGMGGYKGKKATALGLAYQISDRVSGSVAGAANGSERMFNVGFNYLFGQHSDKDIAQCAAAPGSLSLTEAELKAENASLKNKVADQEARISRLEQIIANLAK